MSLEKMYKKSSPDSIQDMFATIAKNYDRANAILSFGIHKKWNKTLVQTLESKKILLDLCAGTGEIAFGFLKKNPNSQAILLDFCPEMLQVAEQKGKNFEGRYRLIVGDAQKIPLKDAHVDAVSISYGIRNVKEPMTCFEEVYRVLKKSGTFAILELTRPKSSLLHFFHRSYLSLFLPILGKLTANNIKAYQYLAQSVQTFVAPEDLKKQLESAGFKKVTFSPLLGGVATLITAKKQP